MCMQVHGFPLMSLLLKKIAPLLARRDVYLQEAPPQPTNYLELEPEVVERGLLQIHITPRQ